MIAVRRARFADDVEEMETYAKADYDRRAYGRSSIADISPDEMLALGGLHIRRLLNAHEKQKVAHDFSAEVPFTKHELDMMHRRQRLADIAIGDIVRQGFRNI